MLIPIDIVHITFEDVKDPIARAFFLSVPTTFSLPSATVERLRDVAGQLLRENVQFQQVVSALRYQGTTISPQCLDQ
jgi:NTE family protein